MLVQLAAEYILLIVSTDASILQDLRLAHAPVGGLNSLPFLLLAESCMAVEISERTMEKITLTPLAEVCIILFYLRGGL